MYNNYGEEKIVIKCYECETGFLLNSVQECSDATGFDNCSKLDEINNVCTKCADEYYFENGSCILPNIDNCLEYDNYFSSTSLVCK